MTPPWVRYLGRRVYLGAVVVLVTAMRGGVTARRAARLRAVLGVDVRTLARWRRWWHETFVTSPFWQAATGRFTPPVERRELPAALLERFAGDHPRDRLVAVLGFWRRSRPDTPGERAGRGAPDRAQRMLIAEAGRRFVG